MGPWIRVTYRSTGDSETSVSLKTLTHPSWILYVETTFSILTHLTGRVLLWGKKI